MDDHKGQEHQKSVTNVAELDIMLGNALEGQVEVVIETETETATATGTAIAIVTEGDALEAGK